MNLFALDEDPRMAARWHCDAHVRKMLLEYTQQLTCAYHAALGVRTTRDMLRTQDTSGFRSLFADFPRHLPYRPTHFNHPCAVWTRETTGNFGWVLELALSLAAEFRRRWGKEHAAEVILSWMFANDVPMSVTEGPLSAFVQCMPTDAKIADRPVEAYRRLYVRKASNFSMRWTNSDLPPWLTEKLIGDVHPGFGPSCVAGVAPGHARAFMHSFHGSGLIQPWTAAGRMALDPVV